MSYIRLIDVQQIRQRNLATINPPYHEVYSNANYPEGWKDIDPFESYRSVFNGQIDILSNPELIFSRGRNIGGQSIRDMVVHQLPLTATGWNTSGLDSKDCGCLLYERRKQLSGYEL